MNRYGSRRMLKIACLTAVILTISIGACSTSNRAVIAPTPLIPGAEYIGNETCAACHEKAVQNFDYTAHGRIGVSVDGQGGEDYGCESCHGPGSLHVEAGGGWGVYIINPKKNPESCFQCHLYTKVQFNLQYRHPVLEERMSCTNCHNPHGVDILKIKGMVVGRENEVCWNCHREQARPHVFEHEALREGCIICHSPHGAINDKLLTERDNNLCMKCHPAQIAARGTVIIGDFNHTNFLTQGVCWSAGCHTAIHGSDINAHLRY